MIKRVLLGILILSIGAGSLLFGEETERRSPDNAVSLDPVWLIFNTYKASYERRLTGQFSGFLQVAYSPDFFWGLHNYNSLTYLDIVVKGRYYFGSHLKDVAADVDLEPLKPYVSRLFTDALGGLYVAVFGGYVNSIVEDGDLETYYKAVFNGFGGGLEIGWKYLFSDSELSFFIEPYGIVQLYGGGYTYEDMNGNPLPRPVGFDDGFHRTGISGGVNFGLTF